MPPELEGSTFVCAGMVTEASTVLATGASGAATEFRGLPVHKGLLPHLSGVGLASAPFRTERVAGRVFFTDLAATTSELVPLTESAMCCGGPGMYFHDQPERSEAILARKFEHVVASGAEVLATENISCLLQLRKGAARYASSVRVMHVFEVLNESIEIAQRRSAVLPE